MQSNLAEDGPLQQPITEHIWREKYRYGDESTPEASFQRVARGVYANDNDHLKEAVAAMEARDWMPGGRIFAGAGTQKRVTWINCFVSPIIQDSMETEPEFPGLGIMDALKVAAVTQQQSGGIGMGFGTLRPCGAIVGRTGSVSSGVLPFMGMWNGMCGTIKSSGSRRGAMMATLPIWHPDVLDFITCKTNVDKFTNFNISVTVSEDFMKALREDKEWDLGFHIPRADGKHVAEYERHGKPWYVYKRVRAAELFNLITRTTYEWAEPGVIFIDRVNNQSNLWYCEEITATNPCGEQPLPPDGDCDLGHVNLANMVLDAFSQEAEVDWARLRNAVKTGVRFLDNVLDTTRFPTQEQYNEAQAKRRIGLGYTGLANLLQQMQVRYGSKESVALVEEIGEFIAVEAYTASVDLAIEKGPFPAFEVDKFMQGYFVKKLPAELQERIRKHGIRNGVLLSLAPTGTTSIFYGNTSGGVEPSFSWEYNRDVVTDQIGDEQVKENFTVEDYGWYLYKRMCQESGDSCYPLPDYMVTALELTVDDHLRVAAAAQKWIDAAISKTINVPKDYPFEDFKQVYLTAYESGMKGCTTYRTGCKRGAVLMTESEKPTPPEKFLAKKRPATLPGETVKIHWPIDDENYYLTMNDYIDDKTGERKLFEVFINTRSTEQFEAMTALTRTVSAACRVGILDIVLEELEQIHSPKGGGIMKTPFEEKGTYAPSLVALIGRTIRQYTTRDQPTEQFEEGMVCPNCKKPAVHMQEGCHTCQACSYSKCG